MRRRDLILLSGAALIGICLNQVTFVYAIKLTTATTVALMFGTLPVFTGLFAVALGHRAVSACASGWPRCSRSCGATLVAVGSGGNVSGHVWGDLLALAATATWAFYSVAAAPVLGRYSPLRVSSVVFVDRDDPAGRDRLASARDAGLQLGASIWLALRVRGRSGRSWSPTCSGSGAIDRVGPSRAPLFANLQPFVAAIFALLLLSEPITRLQVVGGARDRGRQSSSRATGSRARSRRRAAGRPQ